MISLKKPQLDEREIEAVTRVIESGVIAQGPEVAKFEKEFAEYCGTTYAVAVNSGTAALHSTLAAIELSPGDEVITTPFSFVATVSSILMCGGKPVFADICPQTFNIDPETVENKITDKTKAIIGVDLFGQCADWTKLQAIAAKHRVHLLEDAAQAHGATHNGKTAGSFGLAASFSFYATKNMTTSEGGMITTNDEKVADFAKRFRQHGMDTVGNYQYAHLGFNYRTNDILAAIGLEQLKKLDGWNQRRFEIAAFYNEKLSQLEGVAVPVALDGNGHVYHLYTLTVEESIRDELVNQIRGKGVGCGVYYPTPLYRCGVVNNYDQNLVALNAERLCRQVLSVPCDPFLTDSEIEFVAKTVEEAYKNLPRD